MPSSGYLLLGRVVKPHGTRGEMKVLLVADTWEPFQGLTRCWLARPGALPAAVGIEESRGHGQTVVLKLGGIGTPEAAAELVGSEIFLPREALPPPAAGTFYQADVIGLQVAAGERGLGAVREVISTAAHDVFVVDGPEGEWMLPATRAHIRDIDLAAGRIVLNAAADVTGLMRPKRAEGERR